AQGVPARGGRRPVTAGGAAGTLRVAAAQGESVSGDAEANVRSAAALVAEAADRGARVVVLPELFLTGYDPDAWGPANVLSGVEDARLAPLAKVSAERRVVVVSGAAMPGEGGGHISVLVFDDGAITHPYRKQHLTDEERTAFRPGTEAGAITVDGWRLGLGVCYDGCFPEHAMAAAEAGATAYLCPSAYYEGSEHRRDLYYAARALDNGIYVVFAGLTGRCGARAFNGGSAIYDPEGRPVVRLDRESGVVVADLDAGEVARVQQMNPIGQDRRLASGPSIG
ncbi:MAG: carbon-nitrogen hydrolase family protein, partial [Nocardioidaceae bacterium]